MTTPEAQMTWTKITRKRYERNSMHYASNSDDKEGRVHTRSWIAPSLLDTLHLQFVISFKACWWQHTIFSVFALRFIKPLNVIKYVLSCFFSCFVCFAERKERDQTECFASLFVGLRLRGFIYDWRAFMICWLIGLIRVFDRSLIVIL